MSALDRLEIPVAPSRRTMLKLLGAAGVTSVAFGRALSALAEEAVRPITPEMIRQAEWIAGLELTDEQRQLMLDGLAEQEAGYRALRAVPVDNAVPPALRFEPASTAGPGTPLPPAPPEPVAVPPEMPGSWEELAFATVGELSVRLRARQISSVELTRLYLERLRQLDPALECVISRTEDLALRQAARADRELALGNWRGPLHGVPWGAKDLIAVPGYRTTWGAGPYREQVRTEKATVAARLEEAGAVLVAKLTLGELAWGDVWYDGMTKNPWRIDQGSSGSSAGSAAATAAGLVGFALGTETWGSIVSPCTRCGATGLRPTFGRVSRHGVMALAWSMDKVGPIARSAEDCGLVLQAIHGADGFDPTAMDHPFEWSRRADVRRLRVGYLRELFERDYGEGIEDETEALRAREWQENDRRALDEIAELGVELLPAALPDSVPVEPLGVILTAEAAAAFDDLTRSGRDAELVRQIAQAWPNVFRLGQLIPAVEYLRANRVRTLLMRDMERLFERFDVLVTPTYGGDQLLMTNLTGHPAVCIPDGFRRSDGTPTSLTILGRLWGEADALALAAAYQRETDFHRRIPPVAPAV